MAVTSAKAARTAGPRGSRMAGSGSGAGFGSAIYPMRLLGTGTCILIGVLYVVRSGEFGAWHLFLLALALVYPHVSRYLSLRIEGRKRLEYATIFLDAFILGSTVWVVGFSDLIMLSLLTVAFANGMALGGIRLMAASVVSSGLGMGLPALTQGVPTASADMVAIDILASIFLLFYFVMFASVANRRARLLRESRHEVRRQKADIEIEKRKSDGLLWALLPGSLARAIQAGESPAPESYERVGLLVARACDLTRTMEEQGAEAVARELELCFKAFDEIVQRHGLEPFKTVGESYVAVMGAPSDGPPCDREAVIAAARELQAFAASHAESRTHAGEVALDFAFAVHEASAVGGLVRSRRFGFELWGGALDDALSAAGGAASGEIVGDDLEPDG